MKYLVIAECFYALLCFIACSPPVKQGSDASERISKQAIITDSCTINSTTYFIYQSDSIAYIKASGKMDTVYGRLSLRPPVYIVRADKSSAPLTYAYPAFNVDQVLMLFGNEADVTLKEAHGIPPDFYCGTHIQGLLLKDGRASLTRRAQQAVKCRGFSSDEKDFYTLAEDR